MAIGYGVPAPKGKTRKQVKARKDREDAKQLKAFRDKVWARERIPDALGGEWAHCQACGSVVERTCLLTGEVHHRIGCRHTATRYDPDNGVLLCNHLVNNCHAKAENGDIQV